MSMPAAAVSKPVPKAVAKPAPAASIKEIQASVLFFLILLVGRVCV